MQNLDQAIRERAYHLWLADGRPDGHADAHWLAAQRDILSASLQKLGRVAVSETVRTSESLTKVGKKTKGKRRAA